MPRDLRLFTTARSCALFLLAGCPADDVAFGDTDDASSGDSGTSPMPATTMTPPTPDGSGDDDTSEGSGMPGDSSGSSSSSAESDSSSTGEPTGTTGTPTSCGNDIIEADEACDGTALGGSTCLTEGFDAGLLSCAVDCSGVDTAGCYDAPACIEEDLGSALGHAVATGNTTAEDEDLAQSCAAGGAVDHVLFWVAPADGLYVFDTFGSGYDTALALYADCNAGSELACNDDSAGLQSRVVRSFLAGEGVVIAVSGYSGSSGPWVLSIEEFEPGPCCAASGVPGCFDTDCADSVCLGDPSCCDAQWHEGCAEIAATLCDVCNTPGICGNGVLDAGEACDLPDFGGQTCLGQGFDGGLLGCAADCSAIDTSDCVFFDGACCVANPTPGCDDVACSATVCEIDGFCCNVAWDMQCAAIAAIECTTCSVCGDGVATAGEVCDGADLGGGSCVGEGFLAGALQCDGASDCQAYDSSSCIPNGGGDCCSPNGSPGCDDIGCVLDVCESDATCCTGDWTQGCADLAGFVCPTCGGTTPCSNCSFESGDFSGWEIQDLDDPYSPLSVGLSGPGTFPAFVDFAPTDGTHSAQTGWDGNGATGTFDEITIGQEVGVAAGAATATLLFDYRLAWDLTFGATLDRQFLVRIEQPDGTLLGSTLVATAPLGTTSFDGGLQLGNVDLTPYIGQNIRLVFVFTVPEDYVGPAQAELDHVRIAYS